MIILDSLISYKSLIQDVPSRNDGHLQIRDSPGEDFPQSIHQDHG